MLTFEVVHRLLGLVFGVIVLLENDLPLIELISLNCFFELIAQNTSVELTVHSTIYLGQETGTFGCHRTPYHDGTAAKLEGFMYVLLPELAAWIFPPLATVGPKPVDLGSSDQMTRFQSSTVHSLYFSAHW